MTPVDCYGNEIQVGAKVVSSQSFYPGLYNAVKSVTKIIDGKVYLADNKHPLRNTRKVRVLM